jgi:hypothetical protein
VGRLEHHRGLPSRHRTPANLTVADGFVFTGPGQGVDLGGGRVPHAAFGHGAGRRRHRGL